MDDDEEVGVKERKVSGTKKDESKMKNEKEDNTSPKVDIRTLPFPQRYIRSNLDKQFGKFIDYLKEITITIPFAEAIRDMPVWGKFLKDIISHKSKLEDYGLVSLVEESRRCTPSLHRSLRILAHLRFLIRLEVRILTKLYMILVLVLV